MYPVDGRRRHESNYLRTRRLERKRHEPVNEYPYNPCCSVIAVI